MYLKILLLSFVITTNCLIINAQSEAVPFVGAEVFIEPGQTAAEIDTWFKVLKEQQFTVCRIRMFESYMKKADGTWDFSLFDNAFRSAEKYRIKVFANPFYYTEKTDIGGFKYPRDEAHLASMALFLKEMTLHFSQFSSMAGYVLINEPGGGTLPRTDYTKARFEEWSKTHIRKEFTDKGFPVLMDLYEQQFQKDYGTWFMKWIAGEITKYDNKHEMHVNNHAMFQNCAEYDFPEWRKFLTTLGGSAHASWHFGYFSRQQYAVAMSANSEIVRSGAGNIPWWMTELQGGNNTFSGGAPMCSTKEEIAQWIWIVTATEGKGSMFWCLNPRSSGIEAGEWALLDFQDKPTDRMVAATKVVETLNKNGALFAKAKVMDSGINILYVRESLWAESKMATGSAQNYEARAKGGVMKSALSYFEVLGEMGINANLKAFEEFDFSKMDYNGQTIILSHQISVPDAYAQKLEHFVAKGGKLLVDGLTGFFDENLHNTMKTGFAFENLLGGNISEFKLIDNLFNTNIEGVTLPTHLWRGFIVPTKGRVLASQDGRTIALQNTIGQGEALWIPSLLGLGSRIKGDYSALASFLNIELKGSLANVPIRFEKIQSKVLMKTMQSGSSLITMLINKSTEVRNITLSLGNPNLKPTVLYANLGGTVSGKVIKIKPEETIVIEWK
ncbi:MAG: beta-galactosidase trimerization domain-containing protein [Mariniphaga sp.]